MAKLECDVSTTDDLIAAVNAASAGAARGRLLSSQEKVCLFGSSVMDSNSNIMKWAALGSGGALVISSNKLVRTDKTSDMLLRLDDVPSTTTLVVIMEGTNDAANSVTVEDHATNMRLILENMLDRGITPLLILAPPSNIAARAITLEYMNLADYVTCSNLRVACLNPWMDHVDTTNGGWILGKSLDQTNPATLTEKLVGAEIIEDLKGMNFHAPRPYNNVASTNLNMVNPNPLFLEDTDGIPTHWTEHGTSTAVEFASGITPPPLGRVWSASFTDALNTINSDRFDVTAGEEYLFTITHAIFAISGEVDGSIYIEYDTSVGGVSKTYFIENADGFDQTMHTSHFTLTVPEGVSSIRFGAQIQASTYSALIYLAEAQMYNLTAHTF